MAHSDIEVRLQAAITLAQSGQRAEAQRELEAIVALQPELVTAWLWLSTAATAREDRITYLQRALALDPRNETAQIAYAQLTGDIFAPPPTAGEALTPAEDVFDSFDLPEPALMQPEEDVIVVEMPPAPPSPEPIPDTSRHIALIVVTVILVFAVSAFVIALLLDNNEDAAGGSPVSSETIEYWLTWEPTDATGNSAPASSRPTRTPRYSPTPFPTLTALRLPPTWTPAPSATMAPTVTLAPTSTRVPTSEPFIAPPVRSATAAFVQTSDAPAPARQTATAASAQTAAAGTAAVQPPRLTPTLSALQMTVNARFTQAAATQFATMPTPTNDEN